MREGTRFHRDTPPPAPPPIPHMALLGATTEILIREPV